MTNYFRIRSVSLDTSFLLKDNIVVDKALKKLSNDKISCFITTTVISELEQLKIWGRISKSKWKRAFIRVKTVSAEIIDFKNRLLSNAFGKVCMNSMEKYHGVKSDDVRNDCKILVSTLKNGVDLFLSEDFHFTSKITTDVIKDVENAACKEFFQMCDSKLYLLDTITFLKSYKNKYIDLDVVKSRMKTIKKKGKRL